MVARSFYLSLIVLLLTSCNASNDVASDGWLQKRKYRSGFHLASGVKQHHAEKTTKNKPKRRRRIVVQANEEEAMLAYGSETTQARGQHPKAQRTHTPSERHAQPIPSIDHRRAQARALAAPVDVFAVDYCVGRKNNDGRPTAETEPAANPSKFWTKLASALGTASLSISIPTSVAFLVSLIGSMALEWSSATLLVFISSFFAPLYVIMVAAAVLALLSIAAVYVAQLRGESTTPYSENIGTSSLSVIAAAWTAWVALNIIFGAHHLLRLILTLAP
ncbi:MAG: hypothetical protein RLP15_12910 [Cryomorphaceae bacterium]